MINKGKIFAGTAIFGAIALALGIPFCGKKDVQLNNVNQNVSIVQDHQSESLEERFKDVKYSQYTQEELILMDTWRHHPDLYTSTIGAATKYGIDPALWLGLQTVESGLFQINNPEKKRIRIEHDLSPEKGPAGIHPRGALLIFNKNPDIRKVWEFYNEGSPPTYSENEMFDYDKNSEVGMTVFRYFFQEYEKKLKKILPKKFHKRLESEAVEAAIKIHNWNAIQFDKLLESYIEDGKNETVTEFMNRRHFNASKQNSSYLETLYYPMRVKKIASLFRSIHKKMGFDYSGIGSAWIDDDRYPEYDYDKASKTFPNIIRLLPEHFATYSSQYQDWINAKKDSWTFGSRAEQKAKQAFQKEMKEYLMKTIAYDFFCTAKGFDCPELIKPIPFNPRDFDDPCDPYINDTFSFIGSSNNDECIFAYNVNSGDFRTKIAQKFNSWDRDDHFNDVSFKNVRGMNNTVPKKIHPGDNLYVYANRK